jgi:hypothetical protein
MFVALVAVMLLLDGALRVFQLKLMVAQFERFGYGIGALQAFGAAELAAGLLLLIPAAQLFGAGFAILLMALAAFAYVSTGVGFPAAAIVIALMSMAVIWMRLEQRLG